jgi:GNAT superfamily N-acetyltransferase
MNDQIHFELITDTNFDIAKRVQNTIFPEEDGGENFKEAIRHDPYRKEMDYYIVYFNDEPIGVTGIYSYHEYPEDAWLGWFGILPEYRHHGYGSVTLEKTIAMAAEKGYRNFRLYTDELATDAHHLYEKYGMTKELYDNPSDKDNYIDADIYIYSKSLTGEKIEPWNNKILGLKEQSNKEH